MASALFQRSLEQRGMSAGWRVDSAGTWARFGEPAVPRARKLMGELGLDLSAHRSRSVSRELLQPFNLILTMEKGHKESLQIEFPDLADRIFLLKEMVDIVEDIQDPVGGSDADFMKTIHELQDIFIAGFEKIIQLAEKNSRQPGSG